MTNTNYEKFLASYLPADWPIVDMELTK